MNEALDQRRPQADSSNRKEKQLFTNLKISLWFILAFGILYLVGFSVALNALISWIPKYSSLYFWASYSWSAYVEIGAGQYLAGLVIILVAALGSLVSGILLLVIKKPVNFENGLIIATAVIAIIGGVLVVSTILSIILLFRTRKYGFKTNMCVP